MDNAGKNIKKKEKSVKIPCIAKTAKGDVCPNYGKSDQTQFSDKFCPKHHYQAGLTQNEWDNLKLCSGCKSWKLMSGFNKNCDHCLEVGEKKRAKNAGKVSKTYCNGVCRGNNECGRIVGKIGEFCDRHTFQSSYSLEEMKNLQECLGCRGMYSVKSFNGGKSCDKCKGRNGMMNKVNIEKEVLRSKPKSAKILGSCVMKTVSKQKCQNDGIIDIMGQIFCKFHSGMVEEQNKLTKDGKKKCSSSYGCHSLIELNGKYSSCESCRDIYRKKNKKRSNVDGVEVVHMNKKGKRKVIVIEDGDDEEDDEELTVLSDEYMEESVEEVVKVYKKDAFIDSEMERERDKFRLAVKKSDEMSLLEKAIGEKGLDGKKEMVKEVENKVENKMVKEVENKIEKNVKNKPHIDILNKIVTKHNNKIDKSVDLDAEFMDEKKELEGVDLSKCKMSACIKCHKEFPMFLNKIGNLSFKCEYCLGMQRKVEANRVRDKRDYAEELRKNPATKVTKNKWKDRNPVKIAQYSIDGKAKRIEKEGEDYWTKNAEQAKRNREQNFICTKEKQCIYKMTPDYRIKSLQSEANIKNIEWKLSNEEADKLVTSLCHYCGSKNKQSMNTIDRLDSNGNYEINNCVSSCTMCNNMKNSLNYYHFLQIIEHLCAYNKLDSGANCNIDNIPNRISVTYTSYKYRHITTKKYDENTFITLEQYTIIVNKPCYLCGKTNSNLHRNGIDRIDNTIGYELQNCEPCCTTCNFVKSKYDHKTVLNKTKKIFIGCIKKMKDIPIDKIIPQSKTEYYRLTKQKYRASKAVDKPIRVKKTKEQLKEDARIRKDKSRKAMREKMGDTEWKKDQAQKVAEQRKKAKISK